MAKRASTAKKEEVTEVDHNSRIVVLETHTGQPLILRSNPSKEEVDAFVEEHNRRYHAGEAGGPSGLPSRLIKSAHEYDREEDLYDTETEGREVDLSDALGEQE